MTQKDGTEKMNETKVVFSFSEGALTSLDKMTRDAGLSSAQTLCEALRLARIVQLQMANGFTEVVLRDPRTGAEHTIRPPFVKARSRSIAG
jgi:hypothetical protein